MTTLRHFLTIVQTPAPIVRNMLRKALELRARPEPNLLHGKTLLCLFEKPSIRTRVSFEQAMRRLGGSVMSMAGTEVGIGGRESPADIARVLSGMVDAVMARVLDHQTLEQFALHSKVPIINGLSDFAHPAQAIADMLTMIDEFCPGDVDGLRGRTLAFVGDANNVARSLSACCAALGAKFVLCSPPGYEIEPEWVERLKSTYPGSTFELTADPSQAVLHADAVYCDTFVSMGQEHEKAERLSAFRHYQINAELMAQAPRHAIVLHCLPANRGVEITDEVMDGPHSRVFHQAHNRVDAQMGLLAQLLA